MTPEDTAPELPAPGMQLDQREGATGEFFADVADAAPVLDALDPDIGTAGEPDVELTLTGSQFVEGAVVSIETDGWWGEVPTEFTDDTTLACLVPSSATAGTTLVRVQNPDGLVSAALVFTWFEPG